MIGYLCGSTIAAILGKKTNEYRTSANSLRGNFFFLSSNCRKFQIVVAIIFPLCNEIFNNFLTRLQKLFKEGNYSR